jgi:glycosyltransferase involved in cell wall biosynthesis
MKVIIVSTLIPGIYGGATQIVEWLEQEVRDRGHEVEILWIPFDGDPKHLISQMAAIRMIDLSDKCDVVIPIRWPSHLVKHPHKRTWFIHHHRIFFDLWHTLPPQLKEKYSAIKQLVNRIDTNGLQECEYIFTNSIVVSKRLQQFNNLNSEVLYPPLPRQSVNTFTSSNLDHPNEPYFLYVSRITPIKRQLMAIQAMSHVKTNARLVVAGAPDEPQFLDELIQEIENSNLQVKIRLIPRWISDDEKAELIRKSIGVLYHPIDEDSYGYPTLEAFAESKPVITCEDSGGIHEIVVDKHNGLICQPTPQSLASAMDYMVSNLGESQRMGENGKISIERLEINWDRVINKLIEQT